MSWRDDTFWNAASEAALQAAETAELVFVPAEFLPLSDRFVPIEYSWGLSPSDRKLAWCVSKDDVHRLAPWVRARDKRRSAPLWANEVFVLSSNFAEQLPGQPEVDRHWSSWLERIGAFEARQGGRSGVLRAAPGAEGPGALKGPRVLLVGASGMGNVGDDLLANVLAEMLRYGSRARVWCSGPDVSPQQLHEFDAVIVGGGGLIYASRDGSNEMQNLANYLKFGPMAREQGLPVALIGVSDQDHAGGVAAHAPTQAFARRCLADFNLATTRDEPSADFLRALGLPSVEAGPDLLFAWTVRARKAVKAAKPQPPRLAMAGEWLTCPVLVNDLRDPRSSITELLRGQEIDLLVMSDDDLPHVSALRDLLRAAGAAASVQDLRGRDFAALVYAFSQYRALLTTRFHGLVMALICDLPVVAWDHPEGKKARLLGDLGRSDLLATSGADESVVRAVLQSAIKAELAPVKAVEVSRLGSASTLHKHAVLRLLAPWLAVTEGQEQEPDTAVSASVSDDAAPAPKAPSARCGVKDRTADLVAHASDPESSVALCWAASTRESKGYGNLGDSLSAVMVSALSGRPVHHVSFEDRGVKMVAVGSIAHSVRRGEAVVWGPGVSIRGGVLAQSVPLTQYDVRAIRGPISGGHLRDFGIPVPEVYGDPVWLLPSIFDEPVEKRYELGVIPHIQDIAGKGPDARPPEDSIRYQIPTDLRDSIAIINTWHEPTWEGLKENLRKILACKRIVSQSFHGVVIAEAYGIPVLNFRQMPGVANGPLRISLEEECTTDPRIWEFFKGGTRPYFHMYSQRRDQPSDWLAIMQAVDKLWTPFVYDARALVESFPMPLAYDPLTEKIPSDRHLARLRF